MHVGERLHCGFKLIFHHLSLALSAYAFNEEPLIKNGVLQNLN